MKRAILFKTLVDILYILHFIGLIGILFIIPYGTVNINHVNINVEDWNIFYGFVFLISLFTYLIFLRGLYYLRKMARFLLSNKYFSESIIHNLRKSGRHFLLAGITSFILILILWIGKLSGGTLELSYDSNIVIPLFLTIIGMFFIIQSKSLAMAKAYKEENELTV